MAPNRKAAVLYTMTVFLAGMITGGVVMRLAEHSIHPPPTAPAAGPRSENIQAHYVEKFTAELHLSEGQARQLEEILTQTMRQYDDLHSFSHNIRQEGLHRIRVMLDEKQRARFDELTEQMRQSEQAQKGAN